MQSIIIQFAKDASEEPTTAAYVVHATMGISIGQWLNLIPDNIGKLGTLTGVIMSLIVMYTMLRKWKIELKQAKLNVKKSELEIKLIKGKLNKVESK